MTNTVPIRVYQENLVEINKRRKQLAEEYRFLFGKQKRITYAIALKKVLQEKNDKK